jgi:hypothetical protein
MPPTPTHTSRAGDGPLSWPSTASRAIDTYRDRIATLTVENHRLADLLDGVMADDPAAIRDAAAWLATNRPDDVYER